MMYKRNIKGKDVPFSDLYNFSKHDAQAHRERAQQEDLHDFFWRAFAMLRMNKVEGDYCEFGCGSNIRSFRFAWKFSNLESFGERKLHAFDSFAGLPEPKGDDAHPQWQKGTMAVSEEQFESVMGHYRARRGRDFEMIKGFFEDTLPGKSPADHGVEKIAFAHIDCDLYESTMPVLDFIAPALQDGAVLSFDDWFCLNGDPRRGEQRALREWSESDAGKQFLISPYLPFGWHGFSFIVNKR